MNSNIDKVSLECCFRSECENHDDLALSGCAIMGCASINSGGMKCRHFKKAAVKIVLDRE